MGKIFLFHVCLLPFLLFRQGLLCVQKLRWKRPLTSKHCQAGSRQWVDMFVQIKLLKYVENKCPRVFSWEEWILIQCLSVIPPWSSTSNHPRRTVHGIYHLRQSCKPFLQYAMPNTFLLCAGAASDPHINRRQWIWQNTPTTLIKCNAQVKRCNCLFVCILQ